MGNDSKKKEEDSDIKICLNSEASDKQYGNYEQEESEKNQSQVKKKISATINGQFDSTKLVHTVQTELLSGNSCDKIQIGGKVSDFRDQADSQEQQDELKTDDERGNQKDILDQELSNIDSHGDDNELYDENMRARSMEKVKIKKKKFRKKKAKGALRDLMLKNNKG